MDMNTLKDMRQSHVEDTAFQHIEQGVDDLVTGRLGHEGGSWRSF